MGTLQTVLGLIDDAEMGITMSHTHLTLDIRCWYRQLDSPVLRRLQEGRISFENLGWIRRNALLVEDNLVLDDLELAIREVQEYRLGGGKTLIVVDLPGIGRDPLTLQKIARATGLNIVASSGWYIQRSHPPDIADRSIEELAEIVIEEITVGISNTGIKAGNI
ncbi:MAG: phosphotriesterase-related protein, partial [Dehalococcoidia bacterium]